MTSAQAHRQYRKVILPLAALFALTCVYLNGTRIDGGRLGVTDFGGNSSFFSNTHYRYRDTSFNDFFFGSETYGSGEHFVSLANNFEYRRNYGLLNAYQEQAYYQDLSSLSRSSLGDVQSRRIQSTTDDFRKPLEKRAKDDPNLQIFRTPAAVAGMLAAAYMGKNVEYRLNDGVLFRTRSTIKSNRMEHELLGMDSTVANGAIEYAPAASNRGAEGDVYKASISKNIPQIMARAGASYGATTQTTTMSLSKGITDNVSLTYDHSNSNTAPTNDTVGVGFSVGF